MQMRQQRRCRSAKRWGFMQIWLQGRGRHANTAQGAELVCKRDPPAVRLPRRGQEGSDGNPHAGDPPTLGTPPTHPCARLPPPPRAMTPVSPVPPCAAAPSVPLHHPHAPALGVPGVPGCRVPVTVFSLQPCGAQGRAGGAAGAPLARPLPLPPPEPKAPSGPQGGAPAAPRKSPPPAPHCAPLHPTAPAAGTWAMGGQEAVQGVQQWGGGGMQCWGAKSAAVVCGRVEQWGAAVGRRGWSSGVQWYSDGVQQWGAGVHSSGVQLCDARGCGAVGCRGAQQRGAVGCRCRAGTSGAGGTSWQQWPWDNPAVAQAGTGWHR